MLRCLASFVKHANPFLMITSCAFPFPAARIGLESPYDFTKDV